MLRSESESQLGEFAEFMSSITSTLDFDEVIEHALSEASKLYPNADIGILLYDHEKGELLLDTSKWWHLGIEAERQDFTRLKLGEGVAGRAALQRKAVYELDVAGLSLPQYVPLNSKARASLAIPLVSQDKLLGVLNIESPVSNAFSTDDIRILGILGNALAIALRNSLEYRNLQKALSDLDSSRKREAAQASWVTLGQAAIGLAHHVNNIAALIKVECREQILRGTLDDSTKKTLRRIDQRANSITEVFSHLIFPLKESGEYPTELIDIDQVITDALHKEPLPKDVELSYELEPGLPKVEGTALLIEVFSELLANARKAIKAVKSGPLRRGKIWIEARFLFPHVVVCVTNSGRIIPAEEWESVFGLFYRKVRGSARSKSLPFGLWWVRTYLRSIGGDIRVIESNKTEGTTFEVRLPAKG